MFNSHVVASGYHNEQCKYRTFPLLQNIISDGTGLEQGSANYSLQARSVEHSHTCSFTYCRWLLSFYNHTVEKLRDSKPCKAENISYVALHGKSLLTPGLEGSMGQLKERKDFIVIRFWVLILNSTTFWPYNIEHVFQVCSRIVIKLHVMTHVKAPSIMIGIQQMFSK